MVSGIFIFFMFKLLSFLNEILRLLTLASEHLIACFPLLEKNNDPCLKTGFVLVTTDILTLFPLFSNYSLLQK